MEQMRDVTQDMKLHSRHNGRITKFRGSGRGGRGDDSASSEPDAMQAGRAVSGSDAGLAWGVGTITVVLSPEQWLLFFGRHTMRTNHAMQEPMVTGPLKRERGHAWASVRGAAAVAFSAPWSRHLKMLC
jgi:hypothetical protein